MKLKYVICAIPLLFTIGCTSSTKPKVNKPLSNQSQISKTLAQPEQKGLKRVVAIARFSDETKRGNSFLLDKNNNRIGKQASDILSARLTDSGKFIVLERTDEALVDQEMQPGLSNPVIKTTEKNGKTTTVFGNQKSLNSSQDSSPRADYLIIGSVSEYGRTTTSDVGVFSRNKIQTAKVTVNIRLVSTKTKQVIFSQEATGEATSEASRTLGVGKTSGYDAQLDDNALSAAISKLVSNVMENLLDTPWQAYLLAEDNGMFFMSGGKEQGINKNDKFDVLIKGKQIKNPQTGMLVELPGKKVAEIQVVAFSGKGENALSLTSITSGTINKEKLMDYVVREKE